MPIPKLSNVFWVRGRFVVPVGVVMTKDLPESSDNLLYCPAGNNQVLIAAKMITSIKMVMGLGNALFFDNAVADWTVIKVI